MIFVAKRQLLGTATEMLSDIEGLRNDPIAKHTLHFGQIELHLQLMLDRQWRQDATEVAL